MSTSRAPGPICSTTHGSIDAGTLCLSTTLAPGPEGVQAKPARPIEVKKSAPVAPPPPKEHPGAVPNPIGHVGTPVLPNGAGRPECAELVKQLAGAPRTQPDKWSKGSALTATSIMALQAGTAIATGWDSRGFYPNANSGQHSGLFAGPVKDKAGLVIGFTIVEQYRGLTAIASRVVYFDPVFYKKKDTYFYRGLDYATIKW
jgi:hypothetical protein